MNQQKRWIIFLLIIVLIVPTLFSAHALLATPRDREAMEEEEIMKLQELANETGVAYDQLLKWYEHGYDWQTLIEMASQGTSVGEDLYQEASYDEKLREMYAEEDILEVSQRVDMVLFKLDEIISLLTEKEAYEKLKEAIQTEEAIYWTLKLREELGTFDEAFDEYLIAIQLNLDLNLRLEDREQYEQDKFNEELLSQEELITLESIETALMEVLNQQATTEEEDNDEWVTPTVEVPTIEAVLPTVEDPKPVNPSEAIQEEMKALLPMEY